jgi:hypothetical protein
MMLTIIMQHPNQTGNCAFVSLHLVNRNTGQIQQILRGMRFAAYNFSKVVWLMGVTISMVSSIIKELVKVVKSVKCGGGAGQRAYRPRSRGYI